MLLYTCHAYIRLFLHTGSLDFNSLCENRLTSVGVYLLENIVDLMAPGQIPTPQILQRHQVSIAKVAFWEEIDRFLVDPLGEFLTGDVECMGLQCFFVLVKDG